MLPNKPENANIIIEYLFYPIITTKEKVIPTEAEESPKVIEIKEIPRLSSG